MSMGFHYCFDDILHSFGHHNVLVTVVPAILTPGDFQGVMFHDSDHSYRAWDHVQTKPQATDHRTDGIGYSYLRGYDAI